MHALKPDFQGGLKLHSNNRAHKVTRGYPHTCVLQCVQAFTHREERKDSHMQGLLNI